MKLSRLKYYKCDNQLSIFDYRYTKFNIINGGNDNVKKKHQKKDFK